MKRIKEFEPQLAKLKLKYKNDKKGLLAAQSEFYKQKGINPGGGCLPYLFQIIILIALFNVFTRVLSANGDTISKLDSLLYEPLKFKAGEIIHTRFLYLDITKPDVFHIANLPFPIPGPVLVLAALVQLISAKIMAPYSRIEKKIAKKTPESTDDMQVAMQQSMIYTFPLFTIIFGLNFPSGLALYWLLFSVFQTLQQYGSSGWGGLTPWLTKVGLLKSGNSK
jgi:YidC/Oxa1 family membrane protein insertase